MDKLATEKLKSATFCGLQSTPRFTREGNVPTDIFI